MDTNKPQPMVKAGERAFGTPSVRVFNASLASQVPQPEALIVSCSADRDHRDQLTPEKLTFNVNRPDTDIAQPLVISLPGSYPSPDNFDDIADLVTQFPVRGISVITHTDCGVVRALYGKIQHPDSNEHRFDKKTTAIIKDWALMGAKAETLKGFSEVDLAQALSELVAYKVAQDLAGRTRSMGLESPELNVDTSSKSKHDFKSILIGAYVSSPGMQRPRAVILPTSAGELANRISKQQTQALSSR